jgi:predicted transcriptional regulator
MLSVRLNHEQEQQLDYIAMTRGLSKNQIVIAALEQYLKVQDLGTIPLKERVQEASYETFMYNRAEEQKEWVNAVEVAEWAQDGGIWSAKPKQSPSGTPTGAIYGRNTVIGYLWPRFDKVQVLSKYLGPHPSFGAASYRYDVTPFEIWKEHMAYFETVKKAK